jgi:hydroxymethylglutaryl-CoA synthase
MSRDTEIEDALAGEIGRQPREADYASREAYEEAISEYTDALKQTEQYQSWYDRTIEPTLTISRQVGNWYTGSVHIARIAALQYAAEEDRNLAGEKLLVGSYGSGAQAEIHAETVQPNWETEIAQLNVDAQLRARYDLSYSEYEQVHDSHNHEKGTVDIDDFTEPSDEFVFTGWGRMNERQYEYVE